MQYLTAPAWIVRLLQTWQMNRARLGRLLRRQGLDPGAYVRAHPIVEIEEQLVECHLCAAQPLCDRTLRSTKPGRSRYSFCPNSDSIGRFRQRR